MRIARSGTSADRQLEAFERSGGDLKAVVDLILDETMRGVNLAADSTSPG